jgi:rod shape-determining protein MreD
MERLAFPARSPFEAPPPPLARRAAPWLTVIGGSLATILPGVAQGPVLPPLGLLLLVAWRLLRPGALPRWAPAPLGLFDDLVSGQPLGSAVTLWSLAFLTFELIDERVPMDRAFWQDWLIASGTVTAVLVLGRLIAVPLSAHVDSMIWVQAMSTCLLYPAAARCVAWIRRRSGAT